MFHSSNLIVLVWQKEGTKLCAESKSCWWKWTSWNIILWNITAYPSQPIRFQHSVTCDQSKWREVVPLSKRCERSKLPFSASMKIFTWRYLNILWEHRFKVSMCPSWVNSNFGQSAIWRFWVGVIGLDFSPKNPWVSEGPKPQIPILIGIPKT